MHVMVDLECVCVCVDNLLEDSLIGLRYRTQLVEASLMDRWD